MCCGLKENIRKVVVQNLGLIRGQVIKGRILSFLAMS